MWHFWGLAVFQAVEVFQLVIVHSHFAGSFHDIVTQIPVAGFNQSSMYSRKIVGLMFIPGNTRKPGQSGLILEKINIVDLRYNTAE